MLRSSICATAVALLLASPALALQDDMADVQITTEDLGNGLYVLFGRGGNIGLSVGDDATFIIDDQFAPLTERIQAAIGEVTDRPVDFVLNTHWHGDHVGGNENFGKAGAWIVAHDNVLARMSTDQEMKAFNRTVAAAPVVARPKITYSDMMTFHINGEDVDVIHVHHAHTDGDSIIHFRGANVMHMGDTFFKGRFPFIDVGSGGSAKGLIEAVDMALELADDQTQIIPGHGTMATRADLKTYRDMLADVTGKVEALVAEGKERDAVIAAEPAGDYADWGTGFINAERFIGAIVDSLATDASAGGGE